MYFLLRYNWNMIYHFQVYKIMIQYLYVLLNDHWYPSAHSYKKFFLVLRTFVIYTQHLSNIQYIIKYSHCAVPDTPRTYLLYNWKFVPFEHLYPFHPLPSLATTKLFSLWVPVFCLFVFIFHIKLRSCIWYLSFIDLPVNS